MRISILTTITNPVERQDKWLEALACYADFADEVIVVNGGKEIVALENTISPKIKFVNLEWPEEWIWAEYPRHLNYGKRYCTGDWIVRLDIDQFIHEDDFEELRKKLALADVNYDVMTMQKMSFTYAGKYYQKGETEICIRNKSYIDFGKLIGKETDLCFPVYQTDVEDVNDENGNFFYELPIGRKLKAGRTGISYWNYDYYFRDAKVTMHEFWRASRAWNRYWKNWNFGSTEEESFRIFKDMIKSRHDKSTLTAEFLTHSKYIRREVLNIPPNRLGHSGWGVL